MSGIATFIGYVLFRPRSPANQTGGFLSSIQTIHTILSRHAQFSCSFSYPSPAVQRYAIRQSDIKPHEARAKAKERLALPIVGPQSFPLCRFRSAADRIRQPDRWVTIKKMQQNKIRIIWKGFVKAQVHICVLVTLRD